MRLSTGLAFPARSCGAARRERTARDSWHGGRAGRGETSRKGAAAGAAGQSATARQQALLGSGACLTSRGRWHTHGVGQEVPLGLAGLRHAGSPPQAHEQPAADVLDSPKVAGQQQHRHHKQRHVVHANKPVQQVQDQRGELHSDGARKGGRRGLRHGKRGRGGLDNALAGSCGKKQPHCPPQSASEAHPKGHGEERNGGSRRLADDVVPGCLLVPAVAGARLEEAELGRVASPSKWQRQRAPCTQSRPAQTPPPRSPDLARHLHVILERGGLRQVKRARSKTTAIAPGHAEAQAAPREPSFLPQTGPRQPCSSVSAPRSSPQLAPWGRLRPASAAAGSARRSAQAQSQSCADEAHGADRVGQSASGTLRVGSWTLLGLEACARSAPR